MSTQHTPGPWHFTNELNAKRARGKFLTVLPVGDDCPVADVNRHRGPSSEANARLIAAAPDLLTALQDAVNVFLDADKAPGQVLLTGDRREAWEAAVSKAKGTT
jgi:hypothetical protein